MAALGSDGYIPIDPNFQRRGPITEWAEECAAVLRKFRRTAISESLMPDAVAPMGSNMGSLRAPVLIAFFASEAISVRALRPIRIFVFETEIPRFTGDKKPYVYILQLWLWLHDPEKIKQAFEVQAIAKVIGSGWKCDKRTKHFLLLQTMGFSGRDIQKIEVGEYKVNCVLVPDKRYCCYGGGEHDCFHEGSKCKRFMQGRHINSLLIMFVHYILPPSVRTYYISKRTNVCAGMSGKFKSAGLSSIVS